MTDTTKTEALPHEWACAVSWAARRPLTGFYSLRNADILAIQRRLSAVEAERDQARRAIRELEDKLGRADATADALRLCVASMQRDMEAPPGYLQDAVIKAAGLGALHHERDAARAERDRLAAECEALRAALSAILKSPTGCQFCDYGKPRLSIRTGSPCEHDEGCGFVLAHAAMGGKESQGGNGSVKKMEQS